MSRKERFGKDGPQGFSTPVPIPRDGRADCLSFAHPAEASWRLGCMDACKQKKKKKKTQTWKIIESEGVCFAVLTPSSLPQAWKIKKIVYFWSNSSFGAVCTCSFLQKLQKNRESCPTGGPRGFQRAANIGKIGYEPF